MLRLPSRPILRQPAALLTARMPTTDDFIPLKEDLETVYVDEDDFTESDIENMDSGLEDETPMAIDYWFGKMYLRCTIAERVLRDSSYKDAFEPVDVG